MQAKQSMGDALNQLHEFEMEQINQGSKPGGGYLPSYNSAKQKQHKKQSLDRGSEDSSDGTQNDMGMFYDADAVGSQSSGK